MGYIISARTDKGSLKNINQDAFYVKSTTIGRKSIVFGIVCDGLGGLSSGEFASSLVVQSFIQWFKRFQRGPSDKELELREISHDWKEILHICNKKLLAFGERRNLQTGTTINAILIIKNQYMIVNVGDSRAFSILKRIKQITNDHSIVSQEILDGRLTNKEAKTDPRRHILTKSIGAFDHVEADFYFGKIKGNQILIHCSEGFYKEVDAKELAQIFKREEITEEDGLNKALSNVVDLAKFRGEKDDITVLAIKKQKMRYR
ncbi:MAG: serine/threonine-protein phosphatase [Bacillales bacterium]|nr:serine/threonine-protein phosphatase [Bacillales bacterium]